MLFGQKVRSIIEQKGFDVPKMATLSGINYTTLYRLLSKDDMDTKYLKAIANVIDEPVSIFFEDRDSSNGNFEKEDQKIKTQINSNSKSDLSLISTLEKLISNLERENKHLRSDNVFFREIIEKKMMLDYDPPHLKKVKSGNGEELGKHKEYPMTTVMTNRRLGTKTFKPNKSLKQA